MSNADAAEILLEQSSGNESSESLTEVHQIIEDIRRDSLRVNEVIQRLRNLLRRNELEVEPVNLTDALLEALKLVQAEANRRMVSIETSFAEQLPRVPANRVHLQQVIVNLCLNSFESMETCSDRRTIRVTTEVADEWADVMVQDNGPGIPPESLARVFEPFFTTNRKDSDWDWPFLRHSSKLMAASCLLRIVPKVVPRSEFESRSGTHAPRISELHRSIP